MEVLMGRLIAIGDIHGCRDALEAVLEAIEPQADDTIVTLGDYVDRGDDSKGVIDLLLGLADRCQLVPLLGNHEEMMQGVINDREPPYHWLQFGGIDTLDSYGCAGDMRVIPVEHREFLDGLVDYHEEEDCFFVHANYDPNIPLEDQPEDLLRWVKLSEFVPPPHHNGKKAICGHTHDRGGEIFDVGHLVCLDTYCYGGGWLTAMEVRTGEIWQANRRGELRS
jgi:serine/threonine protein phosphatase 1